MQDDQIGPKIVGLAPADVARLPTSKITKKIVGSNLVCQLGLHTPTLNLPCFTYKENRLFLLIHSPFRYFLDIYGCNWRRKAKSSRRKNCRAPKFFISGASTTFQHVLRQGQMSEMKLFEKKNV
jgi:hypothetical protein